MDADRFTDFAASIRYALTQRSIENGKVEIVLDLYRGAVPILTRTVACVTRGQAGHLMRTCRAYLERRGAHALTHVAIDLPLSPPHRRDAEKTPEPWLGAPVAAFDWMFAG